SARFGVDYTVSLDWNSSALPVGNVGVFGPARRLGHGRLETGRVDPSVYVLTYHGPVS
ncbi:hypothetical protein LZ30DRAFT_556202, partial [Colletotrichum cereale]